MIKELRDIYRISMKDLADDIGVSKQLIGQIEKKDRCITDNVLNKLIKYFGLNGKSKEEYKKFFLKDTMDEFEILNIKKAKMKKEIMEYKGESFMVKEIDNVFKKSLTAVMVEDVFIPMNSEEEPICFQKGEVVLVLAKIKHMCYPSGIAYVILNKMADSLTVDSSYIDITTTVKPFFMFDFDKEVKD